MVGSMRNVNAVREVRRPLNQLGLCQTTVLCEARRKIWDYFEVRRVVLLLAANLHEQGNAKPRRSHNAWCTV
jgi:hypothetical protein